MLFSPGLHGEASLAGCMVTPPGLSSRREVEKNEVVKMDEEPVHILFRSFNARLVRLDGVF